MSSPVLSELSDARRFSRFVVRTLLFVGAVVVITLSAAVAAAIWASDLANEREANVQHARVQAAIQVELDQNIIQISGLAAGNVLRHNLLLGAPVDVASGQFALHARQVMEFDGVYIVDMASRVRVGVEAGAPAGQAAYDGLIQLVGPLVVDVLAKAAHQAREAPGTSPQMAVLEKPGVSKLLHDGVSLIAVTVLPINLNGENQPFTPDRLFAVFGYRLLTETDTLRLGERHGIGQFTIVKPRAADSKYQLALKDSSGTAQAALAWVTERPGTTMLSIFVVALAASMGICLALFIAIISRLRRSALQIAMREDEIQRLAGHDPLSGLPNRRAFERAIDAELAKMREHGGGFAVHYLDLDKFKAVNDTYGHKAGDELIRQVAKRLTDLLRGADTLVRFGGDEFAIIQTEALKPAEAAMLGQRILESLTRPFTIDDVQVLIGVSIGIAMAPKDGTDRDTLANLADTALYQAKNEGRNRFNFFEKQMDKSRHLRRIVEEDLRSAIANNELVLHYQPQISADGRTIVGIEALVRWPHKTHGMIPPAEFIPVAEERGLIMQLSDWVLRQACTDGLRWPQLRLAVNVSPIQFRHHDFVSNVAAILSETGFDGTRLELELTEGVVVDDADKAEAAMVDLRALGIGLALDDFGTGYSSLIYLRRFAFDKIKIDRSFLEYMETTGESAILVHSVVHLGRALGLRVCAEGVETAEQHRFLQAVGCHELQGYFFSKPVPADKLDKLLELDDPFASKTAA
jgi:diguanylate cyclase